ncbi:MAG: MAPEG family protein [Pseudomonadota bacterium]
MTPADLFFPALAQIGLTIVLLVWMGRARLTALRTQKVRISQIALGQRAWPERAQRISNAFHNQFEMPVLFYVALLFAIPLDVTSRFFLFLAWAFVVLRLLHLYFHVSGRHINARFLSFCAGAAVLAIMFAMLTVQAINGGAGS